MSIKALKPKRDSHFLQGYFKPKNRDKYIGNPDTIIFRSSYEKILFIILDMDDNVARWNSEGIKIKYFYPVDKKFHTYYPDVYVEKKNAEGKIVKILGEVKAIKFITAPKKPTHTATLKQKKAYLKEMAGFVKNMCKKGAAEKWCKERNFIYHFYTDAFFRKFSLTQLEQLHSSYRPKIVTPKLPSIEGTSA